jgi:hypothetical protein
MKNVNIKVPSTGSGLFSAGPYRADHVYSVPEDVAQHLLLRGAEIAKPSADPKKPDTVGKVGPQHLEHFETVRTFEKNAKADAAKDADAKKAAATDTAAPADTSVN